MIKKQTEKTGVEKIDVLINKIIEELMNLKIKEWTSAHIELLKMIIKVKKD